MTSIEYSTFDGCSGLKSINIPNGVTTISESAFYNTNLISVTIGTGVLTIGRYVFGHDTSYGSQPVKVIWLTNTPPDGYQYAAGKVNYVANDQYTQLSNKTVYPFLSSVFEVDGMKYVPVSPSERTCDAIDCAYDKSLPTVNIGETVVNKGISLHVREVNDYACYGHPDIQALTISHHGNIGNYAFQGCTNLKTATIGKGGSSIGLSAFNACYKLKGIVIPEGVRTINTSTFQGCSSLSDLQIGDDVQTIGNYAFAGCFALPSVRIPQAVQTISDYAFQGCKSLKKVVMDERTAGTSEEKDLHLGSNGSSPLFADCPLDSVYIGRNISYSTASNQGYSPFYRNTSLRSVFITDKETEISPNEFYGCTKLKNVFIGDGVTSIGDWAFSGCANLDYFAFGSNVKTIGKEAFSDCTAVTKLISHAQTPPVCGTQALDDINKWNCTLNVPVGYLSAYQAADQWKDFFFIEEKNLDGIATLKAKDVSTDVRAIYDAAGRKQNKLQRGVNVLLMKDGSQRKVLVK